MTTTTTAHQWVDRYGDYLFSFAYLRLGNRQDAADCVQETLLSAWKARDQFRGESSEKTWLTSILKNKITDFLRKKTHASLDDYLEETHDSFEEAFFNRDNYGRWTRKITSNYINESGESYLIGEEFQRFLEHCIAKMPTKLRGVFVAKFFDEDSSEKICKDYGLSSSNFWVSVFRGRTLLRECLERKGAMPEGF